MKTENVLLTFLAYLCLITSIHAQDPSAILDLESTTDGVLLPRMTEVQRDAISNKVEGLMIYQTTAPAGFYYYDGASWKQIGTGQDSCLWTQNGDDIHYTNGKVGIGTDNPEVSLDVVSDGVVNNIYSTTYKNSGFSAGQFTGRSARGTLDTPSAVTQGTLLAAYNGTGYMSSGFKGPRPSGRIGMAAAENWTDSNNGTAIYFSTTAIGNTQLTERMRISSEGRIGIGTPVPDNLLTLFSEEESRIRAFTYNSNNSSALDFMRAYPGETAVGNSDPLGEIVAYGHEGFGFSKAAAITFYSDGTLSDGSMPGELELSTTSEGAFNPEPRMTIKNDGMVGIGTTKPSSLLHLESDTNEVILRLQSTDTSMSHKGTIQWYTPQNTDTWAARMGPSTDTSDLGLVIETSSLGDFINQNEIVFKPRNTEVMRITKQKVDVQRDVTVEGDLVMGIEEGNRKISFKGDSSLASLGIVGGQWYMLGTGVGQRLNLWSGNDIYFQTHDGSFHTRLYIGSDGNMGVGTTSPSELLDVQGNIKSTTIKTANTAYNQSVTAHSWGGQTPTSLSNAVDEDESTQTTEGYTTGSGNRGYIVIDLDSICMGTALIKMDVRNHNTSGTLKYAIQSSVDSVIWITHSELSITLDQNWKTICPATAFWGRYLRIVAIDDGHGQVALRLSEAYLRRFQ